MKTTRFILIILVMIAIVTAVDSPTGDNASLPAPTPRPVSPLFVTEEEKADFLKECETIGALYKDLYLEAKKIPSPYLWGDAEIPQSRKDHIEDVLIAAGYPLFNSDALYPDYLEHPEVFHSFWEKVQAGMDAEATLWGVAENGGLYCIRLSVQKGNRLCTRASAKWNDNGELELAYMERRDVFFWSMTPEQDFYYQDLILDRHWTATTLLRLQPADRRLQDLYRTYIEPVGYRSANLFLTDWSSGEFGDVCFNDLIEGLYPAAYGEEFHSWEYPSADTPFLHNKLPAALFEELILPRFDISRETLQRLALYDRDTNTYPMRNTTVSNVQYYPDITPVVTDCISLDETTFRLVVRLMCLDYHSTNVLTHEVTIRTLPDGSWQYLGNRVTARSSAQQPPLKPPLGAQ